MRRQSVASESRVLLLHGAGSAPDTLVSGLAEAFGSAFIEQRALITLDEVAGAVGSERPGVLLLDDRLSATVRAPAAILDALPAWVVVVSAGPGAETLVSRLDRVLFALPEQGGEAAGRLLRVAFEHAAARLTAMRADRELSRARNELNELTRIGMALMTERDLDRLLVEILDQAQRLTDSDAGSIYLVEKGSDDEARLRFSHAANDSVPGLPITRYTLPLDRSSLAGYVATTGETLVLDDAYTLSETAPFSFNHSFDERFGYRTRSVLVVPMVDYRGRVVGVLQLINRKRSPEARITDEAGADRWVLGYEDEQERLVRSFAGQAAVSIENSRLHGEIEQIFESFVKAAVTAIDQRDPTTAGHSVRVATLTCDLAEALERHDRGPHAGRRFSVEQMRELRYAALLHDFGKVSVREEVLIKARKLPPELEARVDARFDVIRGSVEIEYHRNRAELFERYGPEGARRQLSELEREYRHQLAELARFEEAVHAANQPTVLPAERMAVLDDLARQTFRDPHGKLVPWLDDEELRFLTIPRGSLDERERREIESHVEQTYRFLRQIPWTDDLRNVAEIAYGHHEKLDGRGYPRGLRAEQIPVQTRIMTIADIFDALTAADRPYKAAVPTEKALDIIVSEAKDGMLDASIVDLLIESGLFRKILEHDWREL